MQALTVEVSSIGEDGAVALKAEVHRLRSEESPLRSRYSKRRCGRPFDGELTVEPWSEGSPEALLTVAGGE